MSVLRAATAADLPAILALNAASVALLSPLDADALAQLTGQAAARWVIDDEAVGVVAFLLALREGAEYASLNYRWFSERYDRFLYVDRVVVAAQARTRGVGTRLYRALFELARASGVERIACEYDVDPPNEASRAFHTRFGFREVGRQRLAGGKQVSLQMALASAASHARSRS